MDGSRIVLAADALDLSRCIDLLKAVGDRLYAIKIHSHYDEYGPSVVGQLKDAGAQRVWVDLKLHDIPFTVGRRTAVLARSGADILTVHASGGKTMLRAARENWPGELYAITLLTSISPETCKVIFQSTPEDMVFKMLRLAISADFDGIVCSAQEVHSIAPLLERNDMKAVVPGVRSKGADKHDQSRVATPAQAVEGGASLLVIGRQITRADNPIRAIALIEREIESVL
jgi:orotidine-5'-phosphate decarboxylase